MINIIVAPVSECKKGETYCKKVVSFFKAEKVEYSVYFSPELNSVAENAKELTKEEETDFIVIGNDVVLNTFLNSVEDVSKIKVGIIPTNGADFAEYLGIKSNPVQAAKDILSGNVEEVDYIKINNLIAVNNILIGASAEIFDLYNQQKVKNAFTKKIMQTRHGNNYPGISLSVIVDKKDVISENIFELSISNAGKAKEQNISPLSNARDGLINLNYATMEEVEERGKYLTQFEKGDQIYDEHTHQIWCKSINITAEDGQIKAMVDGSIVRLDEIDIQIVPNGLKLMKAKD